MSNEKGNAASVIRIPNEPTSAGDGINKGIEVRSTIAPTSGTAPAFVYSMTKAMGVPTCRRRVARRRITLTEFGLSAK